METYQQIKARHQKEVDNFPLGACFSNQQLAEMMKQFGLPNDKSGYAQIVSIGAGCYIKRSDVPAWLEMAKRHEAEMKAFRRQRKELVNALRYEFANHEYQFGNCPDESICAPLGLSWEEVRKDKALLKIYNDALKLFWKDCKEHNWF